MNLSLNNIKEENTVKLTYKDIMILTKIKNIDDFDFENIGRFIPDNAIMYYILIIIYVLLKF